LRAPLLGATNLQLTRALARLARGSAAFGDVFVTAIIDTVLAPLVWLDVHCVTSVVGASSLILRPIGIAVDAEQRSLVG